MAESGGQGRALISETIARVPAACGEAASKVQTLLDGKAKPRGSLGRLEALACRIAASRGVSEPGDLRPVVVIAAADHGIAAEGVSAYPQEVTRQMVRTYLAGKAGVNILARMAGAEVLVVDAGLAKPLEASGLRVIRIGDGTSSFLRGPAMGESQAVRAVSAGIELAGALVDRFGVVGLGEMGIGNTTSAAAITAALLGLEPKHVCGRGTGLDDAALAHKIRVVERALRLHRPDPLDPVGVLAAVGGFEIGVLAGLTLGAAAARTPILLDGFITTAAALLAVGLEPKVADHLIAAHLSPEPGHAAALSSLGLAPLLDLELRLGEGSGAALALPLLGSALALLAEMATFESAGVTDTGR